MFNKFTWTITGDPTEHFEFNGDEVSSIKVLDKLLAASPKIGYTTKTALEGTIVIDVDCKIDEYDIYAKYSKDYPNVIIEYTNKVTGLDPAVEILFKSGDSEDSLTHYRVLGSGDADGASIGTLISAQGPTGEAIKDPSRGDTSENTYEFTGYWKDSSGNKYYVNGLENPEASAKNFDSVIPTTDMTFYPEFLEDVKKHEIKFFDYDNNVILQNGKETFGVPYGMTYAEAGGPLTNFYYKDSGDLPAEQRYGFKGWSTSRFDVDEGKNIEFIDLETYVIEKAMNLYPYYETEDVRKVPSSIEYFDIKNGVISLKDEYKETLQGKITIPTVDGVTQIGSFGNGYAGHSEITHVYFLEDSKINAINMNAFAYCRNLELVNLPNTVRVINGSAFASCEKLVTVTLNDNITVIGSNAFSSCKALELNALPASLIELGSGAFQSAGPGVKITSIPAGVEILSAWAFNGCSNVKISAFGGANGESSLKTIENNCFNNTGNSTDEPAVDEIIINYSVQNIGVNAFYGYVKNTLKSVYFARPYEGSPAPYGVSPYDMGFTNPDVHIGQLENA